MILLLDVGNSRVKWAWRDAGGVVPGGAVAHDGAPAEALATLALDEPDAVWISNVTGGVHDLALTKIVAARWQLAAQFARSQPSWDGLVNAYAEPARLGVDRWVALVAAWSLARGACVVADAGTALTVDAVDAQGRHLGGIIAAGLKTSERAVLGATRFGVRTAPLLVHAGLGRDTESCVRQGALQSVLGAIDRVAATVPGARRFLTGGDAETLAPELPGWELRPLLVLEGVGTLAG